MEILCGGVLRACLCRIREENANWRTLAKLSYNGRRSRGNNKPCIGLLAPLSFPFFFFSLLFYASRSARHFCPLPLKHRKDGGKKSCIHPSLSRVRENYRTSGTPSDGRCSTLCLINKRKSLLGVVPFVRRSRSKRRPASIFISRPVTPFRSPKFRSPW